MARTPEQQKLYYQQNKERLRAQQKEYYERNKEAWRQRRDTPEGRESNRKCAEKYRKINPDKVREAKRAYYQKHKKRIQAKIAARRASSPQFRLAANLRNRLRNILYRQSTTKAATSMELVGCTVDALLAHLERQFEAGMSWDNYGKWHVDHRRMLSEFDLTNPEEQRVAFHYTNLRPLWAKDNLSRRLNQRGL